MAEWTMSKNLDQLMSSVGSYLGYGRGDTIYTDRTWTQKQLDNITDCIKTGLSTFYNPPALQPGETPHVWSFMRPFATVAILSGVVTANLPDDFGYFQGPIYISSPAGSAGRRWPIQITNESYVQGRLAAYPETTGPPSMAAQSVIKGTTDTEGTRYCLVLWPKPDQNYTLLANYTYLADMLTGALPFHHGGSEHAETVTASCIAAAELYLDDEKGNRWQYFMERLAASVGIDRRKKGVFLGKNIDRSDRDFPPGRSWRDIDNPPVTYNGNPL